MYTEDINLAVLIKGTERYIFLYTDANRDEILQQCGRFASNSNLSFTWYDAAVISTRMRRQGQKSAIEQWINRGNK